MEIQPGLRQIYSEVGLSLDCGFADSELPTPLQNNLVGKGL